MLAEGRSCPFFYVGKDTGRTLPNSIWIPWRGPVKVRFGGEMWSDCWSDVVRMLTRQWPDSRQLLTRFWPEFGKMLMRCWQHVWPGELTNPDRRYYMHKVAQTCHTVAETYLYLLHILIKPYPISTIRRPNDLRPKLDIRIYLKTVFSQQFCANNSVFGTKSTYFFLQASGTRLDLPRPRKKIDKRRYSETIVFQNKDQTKRLLGGIEIRKFAKKERGSCS